jgi:hypothetical protein
VPSDQRVRLDDDEEATPVDQAGQGHQRDARRIVRAPGFQLPFEIQANCFRRNKFSAARFARDCSISAARRATSARSLKIVLTARRNAGWLMLRESTRSGGR